MICRELDCKYTFITLDLEGGESINCMIDALYEIEGKKYASVLLDVTAETELTEESEVEGSVYLYEDLNDEEFELTLIESDEEFERIATIIENYENGVCKELDCDLTFITLDSEDGESEECLVAGLYEIEGNKYLSVAIGVAEDTELAEDDEVEGYVFLYREINDEEFELDDIESDEEFQRIVGIIEAYEEAQ